MAWKRFFTQTSSNLSPLSGGADNSFSTANAPNRNFTSFLPEVYASATK